LAHLSFLRIVPVPSVWPLTYLVPLPQTLPTTANKEELKIRDLEYLEVIKDRRAYLKGLVSLYSVVIGQCTAAMREKIAAMTESEAIAKVFDGIGLLNLMHGSNFGCVLSFLNDDGSVMPRSWILLDKQSTVDVFCNAPLLSNIREGLGSMTIHCNAGTVKTTTIVDLPGYC
jgi:hypothetical protein